MVKFRLSVRSTRDPEGETYDREYGYAMDAWNAAIAHVSDWEKKPNDNAIEFKIIKVEG
jgi:hypothetical protein